MTDPSALVARLAQHRTLCEAPREELEWLAQHGEIRHFERGELLASNRAALLECLSVVLSGHVAIYVDHGAGPHKVMEWSAGDVTGLLPYSRMSKPIGTVIVDEPIDALAVDRSHFPDMIRECPTITTTLVHVMIDRARQFRSSELQDEKMLSLGKLSAGLAHELNNPASAAARSAKLLADTLGVAEEAARALGAARLTEAQLAAVDRLRQVCAITLSSPLTPIERADREGEIAAWLEAYGLDPNEASSLADTAVTIQGLDSLASVLDARVLTVALRWVAAGCTTRALASDVERAAARISKLIGAVKRFSYMDRALIPEALDVIITLNDSVTLLQHKARKKSVGITVDAAPALPLVRAIGGDLNQVWTNLIDNAIDAAPQSGQVTISAERRLDRVIVRIVDNGAGIDPAIRDRIFDPFVTSKPVGQGTGLGLDIARQLVRRNSGDIEVESRPGRTEFSVILPVSLASTDSPAASRIET